MCGLGLSEWLLTGGGGSHHISPSPHGVCLLLRGWTLCRATSADYSWKWICKPAWLRWWDRAFWSPLWSHDINSSGHASCPVVLWLSSNGAWTHPGRSALDLWTLETQSAHQHMKTSEILLLLLPTCLADPVGTLITPTWLKLREAYTVSSRRSYENCRVLVRKCQSVLSEGLVPNSCQWFSSKHWIK